MKPLIFLSQGLTVILLVCAAVGIVDMLILDDYPVFALSIWCRFILSIFTTLAENVNYVYQALLLAAANPINDSD